MVDTNKLRGAIVAKGKDQQQVAKEIGIDRSTFYRKMKEGGAFTIEEVSNMAKTIPLTNEEAIDIFLNNESQKRDKQEV